MEPSITDYFLAFQDAVCVYVDKENEKIHVWYGFSRVSVFNTSLKEISYWSTPDDFFFWGQLDSHTSKTQAYAQIYSLMQIAADISDIQKACPSYLEAVTEISTGKTAFVLSANDSSLYVRYENGREGFISLSNAEEQPEQ